MELSQAALRGLLVILALARSSIRASSPFHVEERDAKLRVPQLIQKYGYKMEEHQVETEDGYLLGLYRIPGKRNSTISKNHPVLMMHSWFSSCSDWVLIGPGNALGYLLADRGYDVWLGNARGNRYSRRHRKLRVRSKKFWDFSIHEIGYYDVPALIDYVLGKTGKQKLHYVGFSQGTIVSLVALSSRPEYNAKVIQAQLLSPAAYAYRSLSILMRLLAHMAESLAGGYTAFGSHELLPNWRYQYEFYRALCPAPQQLICRMLIYEVAGANPDQLDTKMLRIFLGHFPAGSGIKQFLHYAQYIRGSGIFRQFDYGGDRLNRNAYGSATVPRYNLTRVSTSVWTYYGLNDNVVNYRNVRRLERELPNLAGSYQVPDERFTHADFILSNNVKRVLYRKVIRNLEAAERSAN